MNRYMQYKTLNIFYDNCKKNCKHCFCKPSTVSTIQKTEQLLDSLLKKKQNVKVYITDQSRPEIRNIIKRVEYNLVELKDEININHVNELKQPGTLFGLSLHGHKAGIHDLLCHKGNFDKTIKALEKARQNNLPNVRIYCVIHKKNYLYIEDLCDLVEKYGVKNVTFLRLSYMGFARNLPDNIFLDKQSYIHFFDIFNRVRARFENRVDISLVPQHWGPRSRTMVIFNYLHKILKGRYKYFCAGGHDKITIHSGNKEVYPCTYLVTDSRFRMGRYDENKGILIENPIDDSRLLEKIGEPCRSCRFLRWCGGYCRGIAVNEHLRLTGEFDIYAGHEYCPIALGIKNPLDIRKTKNAVRLIWKYIHNFTQ